METKDRQLTSKKDMIQFILCARSAIAKLGETDQRNWWNSNALSRTGKYVCRRTFPKTWQWVCLETSLRAAQRFHDSKMDGIKGIHLFRLPGVYERNLQLTIHEFKTGGSNVDDVVGRLVLSEERIDKDSIVEDVLSKYDLGNIPVRKTVEVGENAICVGIIRNLMNSADVSMALAQVLRWYGGVDERLTKIPFVRVRESYDDRVFNSRELARSSGKRSEGLN